MATSVRTKRNESSEQTPCRPRDSRGKDPFEVGSAAHSFTASRHPQVIRRPVNWLVRPEKCHPAWTSSLSPRRWLSGQASRARSRGWSGGKVPVLVIVSGGSSRRLAPDRDGARGDAGEARGNGQAAGRTMAHATIHDEHGDPDAGILGDLRLCHSRPGTRAQGRPPGGAGTRRRPRARPIPPKRRLPTRPGWSGCSSSGRSRARCSRRWMSRSSGSTTIPRGMTSNTTRAVPCSSPRISPSSTSRRSSRTRTRSRSRIPTTRIPRRPSS